MQFFNRIILVLILMNGGFQLSAQLNCVTIGNLDATNLALAPSSPIFECQTATITAEWLSLTDDDVPYDAGFHEATLLVSIPNQLLGTSGMLSVAASDGMTYWNVSGISQTDSEVQVPLQGVIPSGVEISIIISDMTVVVSSFFESFNYSQSISLAIADCQPTDDEQSLQGQATQGGAPSVTDIDVDCAGTDLELSVSAISLTPFTTISGYSWEGPNNFTSTDEDPVISLPSGDKSAFVGTYSVTVTSANGCTTVSSIPVDPDNCAILPVEYVTFNARANGSSADLIWITANEENNDHFSVQHSMDGVTWNAIGRVNGSANTSWETRYLYTHEKPNNGINYYRLEQFDLDGRSKMSEVRSVRFENKVVGQMRMYPNPAQGRFFIDYETEEIGLEVNLLNIDGRLVKKWDLVNGQEFDVKNIPPGMYVCQISDNDGFVIDQKRLLIIE